MTTSNQRGNNHWGDELTEKAEGIMRVYSTNVNGISLDRRGGKFNDICSLVKEIQCDIFCGQEHNLDTNQSSVRTILYDTAQQHWDRIRLNLGTTPIEFKTQYKPGGTLILTTGNTTGRTAKQEQDKWGRWVITYLHGRGDSKAAIVTVYQVVDKHGETGVISAARQQQTLLLRENDITQDPRTAFRRDLRKELQTHRDQGIELLVLGDFNESFGEDIDGVESIANELGMVHLMQHRHKQRLPATYARGRKCIDYALGTSRFQQALTGAGYEPFNQRIHSDHRGYFLDFKTEILFGMDTPSLSRRESRMLQSWNVPQVTAYIRYKYDLLEKQNAFNRGYRLTFLGNRHAFAERLDKDVLDASLTAEKHTFRYREPAWSIELAEARKTVRILSKTLSAIRTGLNLSSILQTDMLVMNTRFELPTTKVSCSQALREAKQHVQQIVAHSYTRRDEERNKKIIAFAHSTNPLEKAMAKNLRRLKKSEAIRQMFGKLRRVQTTQERRGVTRLEIPIHPEIDPKSCTEWQQIDVPEQILEHLIKRNQEHFGQAHGTPFTIPPLATNLGFSSDTEAGEAILQGDFDSHSLDQNVQLLIRHLQQIDEMKNHPSKPTITDDEYVAKLKVWSENTTTSPSGLHLGHYKALIGRHTHSLDASNNAVPPEFVTIRDELEHKQKAIRTLHLQLLNYALERGYSYSRWQTVANTILFKDADNCRIHRTRVIHLYEADYNMALGIKWRSAMHQAEDLQCLNDGQYGSRPRRSAVDPVILEEVQYEISRATRTSLAITSYDAMACYDRIVPSVAMLASRKYGVAPTVTRMNAETLKTAKYRLKTETGMADKGYTHEDQAPIYGTGQGSANSPAIWCFVSSTLFDCYDELAHTANYFDPTHNLEIDVGMTGFVDDCGGQTTERCLDPEENHERLRAKVEHNAQVWTNLLSASGGALELTKCSCHMVEWQFSIQGAPVMVPKTKTRPIHVQVTDPHTRKTHQVQVLSPFQAHKTLGHHKEPAGTQSTQFKSLKSKSDTITEFLWHHQLSRAEAWTYYYACYLPAVVYPLSASSMTENQLAIVQRKALSIIVARCGYNRNTKHEILFGPASLGGANFRHLYVEQGIGQVTLFMRHWRKSTTVGVLLRIAISWYQLATGVSYSILETPHQPLPHLESKWIKSMREYLAQMEGSLRLDAAYIQQVQRAHDTHIMDTVLASHQFTDAEVRRLNYCRLYLQVVTISDMATLDGDYIDSTIPTGNRPYRQSVSRLEWPRQDRPSPREWTLWRSAVTKLWSDETGKLTTALGPWLMPIHEQRQRHRSYRHGSSLYVIDDDEEMYRECQQLSAQQYGETQFTVAWDDIPPQATPVNAVQDEVYTCWRIISVAEVEPPDASNRQVQSFEQYINSLEPWETALLQHHELYTDPQAICFSLEFGLRAASDGSVRVGERGTFGWTISTDIGERAASGMGPVGGAKQNPYRAEALGMLSLLCFLRRLAIYTGKHDQWHGTIATDSQKLLDSLTKWTMQVKSSNPSIIEDTKYLSSPYDDVLIPEWDILVEIHHLLQSMPRVTLEYVKSHQDRIKPYHQLSLLAQLNVDADTIAKRFQIEQGGHQRPFSMLFPHTGAHLDLPDGTITAHIPDTLRSHAWGAKLKKYLKHKYNWTETTISSIHWLAHARALQQQSQKKTHMTKLVHDLLPTNSRVHRSDQRKQGCPVCTHPREDRDHVLHCTASSRAQPRETMLRSIQAGCEKHHTHPDLQRLLLTALREWMASPDPTQYCPKADDFPEYLQTLIDQQTSIGWRQIINGRLSSEWAKIQEEYHARQEEQNRQRKMTGKQWLSNIIGEIWEAWFRIWETRNQDIHGFDASTRTAAIKRQVESSLRDIYAVRHQLEPSVRELLEDEVEVHRNKPLWVNQNWLRVHGPLVSNSLRKFKSGVLAGVRSIKDYAVPKR